MSCGDYGFFRGEDAHQCSNGEEGEEGAQMCWGMTEKEEEWERINQVKEDEERENASEEEEDENRKG